jgi:hypothetical protein
MEQQLATLTLQEVSHKRDLSSLGQAININALDNWDAEFEEYLTDLRAGVDELKDAAPQNDEERHNLFLLKNQVIDTLVERVTINKNREIKVEIRPDLLAILDQDSGLHKLSPAAYSRRGEIYSHKYDLTAILFTQKQFNLFDCSILPAIATKAGAYREQAHRHQ